MKDEPVIPEDLNVYITWNDFTEEGKNKLRPLLEEDMETDETVFTLILPTGNIEPYSILEEEDEFND